jgi:HK97 family phage portal protein
MRVWESQPAIRQTIDFMARQVATLPLHVFARVDDTERHRVTDSPVTRVLGRPSKLVTPAHFWHGITVDFLLTDAACAVVAGDELVRVPPNMVELASDKMGRVNRVEIVNGADRLDVTDVPGFIVTGWGMSEAGGVSPLKTLAALIGEQSEAVDWQRRQWADRPKIAGMLTRPAEAPRWSDENRERFLKAWDRFKAGAVDGSTPVLEQGMEYQPLTQQLSPVDAQILDGRRLGAEEVATAYHVPPELMGVRPGTFSNVQAFRTMLYGPILGPMLTMFEQAVNQQLVPGLDDTAGLYVEFNREAGMAGSTLEQAQVYAKMVGGPVMTRAEARARMNLPYIEGTDDLIVPVNLGVGEPGRPELPPGETTE